MARSRSEKMLASLAQKYVQGKATAAEKAFLEKYYGSFEKEQGFPLAPSEEAALEQEMLELTWKKAEPPVIRIYQRSWFRIAASVVLLLAAGISYLIISRQPLPVVVAPANVIDFAPGGDKAFLTLSDGTTILLDSAVNGNLVREGDVVVQKMDGQLSYAGEDPSGEVHYNTITTPKGGKYQLILADGSKVWLNASSSLRYPAAFTGKDRVVELTGEAYFEVKTDRARPFRVVLPGGGGVEVLGTHFNINSYSDEPTVNTTLFEGKVRVVAASSREPGRYQVLLPGQQARQGPAGQISINNNADLEQVIAWKNGKFLFGDSMDMEEIMRQLARWYDVEVEFHAKITEFIGGSISRDVNASQVFHMLEETGAVKFKIEGRKVIVMAHNK
ncbi:MAG TPA: FecR domain-containing protein [Lacibacter sp.]|nr:FecR domain-containing protein [Lacibacter sp.]HMO88035.1 FecR domain-containing protein [Lacibacter sp.]HMP85905.1 FecR domain-containing protein [Lacibacter sp.]